MDWKKKRELMQLVKAKVDELQKGNLDWKQKREITKALNGALEQLNASIAAMPEGTPEPEGVKIANDILAGKYDDVPRQQRSDAANKVMDLDEKAYGGLMDQVDAYLTSLTQKKAKA